MGSFPILSGHYDYRLVALSLFTSILAAYATLDLAERVTMERGRVRLAWLCGGACALGFSYWDLQYLSTVAYHLPIPVLYDWPAAVLSLFAAILASGLFPFGISRQPSNSGLPALARACAPPPNQNQDKQI
jgi:NO-binding membrane sensor protein with MHYT domain